MSLCAEQAEEAWISGAIKSKSGWLIFGDMVVYAEHDTGACLRVENKK